MVSELTSMSFVTIRETKHHLCGGWVIRIQGICQFQHLKRSMEDCGRCRGCHLPGTWRVLFQCWLVVKAKKLIIPVLRLNHQLSQVIACCLLLHSWSWWIFTKVNCFLIRYWSNSLDILYFNHIKVFVVSTTTFGSTLLPEYSWLPGQETACTVLCTN